MKIIEKKLKELLKEVNRHNFNIYIAEFESLIKAYRARSGQGKPLYELLWSLWEMNNEDEGKDEVLGEMMSLMCGYCSPSRKIEFDDLQGSDFESFDVELGKFVKQKDGIGHRSISDDMQPNKNSNSF